MLTTLFPEWESRIQDPSFWLSLSLILSLSSLLAINVKLAQVFRVSVQLKPGSGSVASLSVIVPAYNEAANVIGSLTSILDSTPDPIQVWLVDDGSTDATWQLATEFAQQRQDPRLHLLAGQPRPSDAVWVGKNWACTQAAAQIDTDYLLFLDCDVRLEPGAIEAALSFAKPTQPGLLTVCPQIVCGCLPEWLVQPVMMMALAVGFDFVAVNDQTSPKAFAAGPFMLFRRSAYEQIGGHAAVAAQVVEDVELARLIKGSGLGLRQCFSGGLVKTRMYADGSALWEGWTKNWFLGLGKSWILTILVVILLLLVYVLPWVGLVWMGSLLDPVGIALSLLAIGGQLVIRIQLSQQAQLPSTYWWLTSLGGLITACIVLTSAYRTSTGRGWTWRGRLLQTATSPDLL